MKEFIQKKGYVKVEFWAATTILVFNVFYLISAALSNDWAPYTGSGDEPANRMNYFLVSNVAKNLTVYLVFLVLNFKVVPALVRREAVFLNVFLALAMLMLMWIVFGSANTYLKGLLTGEQIANDRHNSLFQKSLLHALHIMLLFGFYSGIKYFSLYLLSHSEAITRKYKFFTMHIIVAFIIWMAVMFLLVAGGAEGDLKAGWAVVVPFGILYYAWSFYSLIPGSLMRKRSFLSYMGKTILVLAITFLPVLFLTMLLADNDEVGGFNALFQFFITMPMAWVMFKRQMRGNEELYMLRRELGRSNAHFDFLRSQINPHFLFNSLNTIYGTALQEKAERTSEGIQMLGDMMRFMLQENMQEKIPLSREVEYLNNYISLQRLRTDASPVIQIDAEIELPVDPYSIAPMLLIPFVENAFKHGISFREASIIRISLEVKDRTLQFQVYNSRHLRPDNDPEKEKSGIGLTNVQQRLKLLYPGKHELIVKETKKDFFTHLSIKLS